MTNQINLKNMDIQIILKIAMSRSLPLTKKKLICFLILDIIMNF